MSKKNYIKVTLSTNNKNVIIEINNILFVEDCNSEDKDGKQISFTRIYFKKPLLGENESSFIDVNEDVNKIYKML